MSRITFDHREMSPFLILTGELGWTARRRRWTACPLCARDHTAAGRLSNRDWNGRPLYPGVPPRHCRRRSDAIIASRIVPHFDEPDRVLAAKVDVAKPDVALHMASPAERAVDLSSDAGCLSIYEDPDHQKRPRSDSVVEMLSGRGLAPIFQARAFHPHIPFLIAAALEPLAVLNQPAQFRSTWAFLWVRIWCVARQGALTDAILNVAGARCLRLGTMERRG